MKNNKLLEFALIGIGIGTGIYLAKKYNKNKNQKKYDETNDKEYFDDEDFYCDIENGDVIQDKYSSIDDSTNKKEYTIQPKDLEETTSCECINKCTCEKQEVCEKTDELTNKLNKEVKEEILKQKEKIIMQREELFRQKRDGILVGKEFKDKKKALGQQEEKLNRMLAEMKK